jgi:hypothetical protein
MDVGGGGDDHGVDAAEHRSGVGSDVSSNVGGYNFGSFDQWVGDYNRSHRGVIGQRSGMKGTDAPCSDQSDSHTPALPGHQLTRYPTK